jgi:alkylation response protein AidB-like acyl-CoA dehydrogenase
MDFRFTPEEEAFRAEVHNFIEAECPPTLRGKDVNFFQELPNLVEWRKKIAEKGWIAPAWPKEYGGAGMTIMEQFIYSMETARMRSPAPIILGGLAVAVIGPTIIIYGTEEQKQKHITKILAGEEMWCQGFSEPGSGSDLASVQTKAVRDGDDYVINGQKIWTTLAHMSQYMLLLARTDADVPKHKGLSYFIVPMNAPGVETRPLMNMAGSHEFNEVFFDNVRIPAANLIGEENRGWYQAVTTLDIERSSIGSAVGQEHSVEDLIQFVKENKDNGATRVGHQPSLRIELADRYLETQVSMSLSMRVVSMQSKALIPNYEASAVKLYSMELNQRIANTGLHVTGLYGQLARGTDGYAPMKGRLGYTYLRAVANTIEGGTSEIQRNIVAQRGLGLSRE